MLSGLLQYRLPRIFTISVNHEVRLSCQRINCSLLNPISTKLTTLNSWIRINIRLQQNTIIRGYYDKTISDVVGEKRYLIVEYKRTSCQSFVNVLKGTNMRTDACGIPGSQRMITIMTSPTPTHLRTAIEVCYTQCMCNGSNILNYIHTWTTEQYRVLERQNYGIIIIMFRFP
jgi:hypothetical protein